MIAMLGMDVIIGVEGFTINKDVGLEFGDEHCAISMQLQVMDSENSNGYVCKI